MIRRIISLSLLLLLMMMANGQIPGHTRQRTVDSLFILLPEAVKTDKADILNELALHLAPRSFDSSFRYATQALRLSEDLNYQFGRGVATFNIGNSYYFNSDIKNTLINYLSALRLLEPFEPAIVIGDLLFMLGSINEYVRNTEILFKYYNRAATNYIGAGDSAAAMIVYYTLGWSYYAKMLILSQIDTITSDEQNTMLDSAIRYNEIALKYYLVPHNNSVWMSNEAWLSNIYTIHGGYYNWSGDSLGMFYNQKAFETSKTIKDDYWRNIFEGECFVNLGVQYYFTKNNPDKGYPLINFGVQLLKKTERYDFYSAALMILGIMEKDTLNYPGAISCFEQALNASDTFLLNVKELSDPDATIRLWGITQIRTWRVQILNNLVDIYELTGDLKKALLYQKKLAEENRLQTQDVLNRQIMVLQVNYENDLKTEQLNLLAKENDLNKMKFMRIRFFFLSFAGLTVILGLILLLFYQKKRMKSEQKSLILEQKLLRSQMNPHFLFNSLTSIQNFIVCEKPDAASIYLSKFSKLVRNILDNSVEEYVPLEKEISTIENYIELQRVRWAGKFDYCIKIAPEIDDENIMIPPMLAQPFIENAIEHGVKHRQTPGFIDIRFTRKNHSIIFEIEDNGVGREKAREFESLSNDGHRSMATSITRERLDAINKKQHRKITLEITDLKNESGEAIGTLVTFGIPIQNS